MIDLFLRAGNAGAFASACPWLRGEDQDGERVWLTAGDGWVFDPIGELVLEQPQINADGSVEVEAVIAEGWHGNLRCTDDVAARVPATIRVSPTQPRRRFAGDPADVG